MKKKLEFRQPQIQTFGGGIEWTKIRAAAEKFSEHWKGEPSEAAEAQTFWNQFFEIFGRNRRGLALYEYHARYERARQGALTGVGGRIDMLWPGVLAVEHKSAGKNIGDGEAQLFKYINHLPDDKKPRYGLVCNFTHFRLIDIEASEKPANFPLSELGKNVERFGFFIEHERRQFTLELQASKDAVALMEAIYDALQKSGHDKEVDRLLVRLLFCMFAEDTGILERGVFLDYLQKNTREDGGDLGAHLAQIFDILNRKNDDPRRKALSANLQKFPYINGDLFSEQMSIAAFDEPSRDALLDACRFDWSKISPAIFGALFQSVRDSEARRKGGEHYTSEENIMKVIRPLFLDELEKELKRAGDDKRALKKLHDKIADIRFLDPACGCGNFLIIAYRELRRLEMEILLRLSPKKLALDITALCRVNVDQFYGVEIDSFPAKIAQTAMWLVDHQMNRDLSEMFGDYYIRIPLTTAPHILQGNALTLDWEKFAPPKKLSYVLGNPPFVDRKNRSPDQRREMACLFGNLRGAGNLDYVTAWYVKAARYICGTAIRCAFVSTDSITQSMQASVLWNILYGEGIKIHFAHRSFKWRNEANGVAQVRVVIIGFGADNANGKKIYEYDAALGETRVTKAANINAYLMDAADILIARRSKPLCDAPIMTSGSNPIDNGHLLLSYSERKQLLQAAPQAAPFVRPVIGGDEFVHGTKRWCLWLDDAEPSVFRKIKPIMSRVKKTRQFRAESKRKATRDIASSPHLFGENRQPESNYLVVPQTTSGNRRYIPLGFSKKRTVALIKCQIVPKADLFHFGVLSSEMHMAWVRTVGGRLGGGYSYTASLVYNTFAWPQKITATKKERIKKCAQAVLDARKNYPYSSLADLYSTMPKDLAAAHRALDIAVDRAYRPQPFPDERLRLEFLFAEYNKLTAPALPPPPKKRRRKKKQ